MKKALKAIKSSNKFQVVGIGASAGGLEAFKKLLRAIPENSGMAYVLVQHLDPHHESMLPDLLQKVTKIPVLEISDDIKVEPDHIYVIPSNKIMVATDGVLLLTPRPESNRHKQNLPIDIFFTSLAEVHQSHAIGVVLSGTASDGTAGLKAIKDHGGITFAQDEESAAYQGMPNSAISAGVVDFVLPPEQIPEKMLDVSKNINGLGVEDLDIKIKDEEVFKKIITLLRIRKGTDFTYYKQTTIHRRILRRIALGKSMDLSEYLKFLRENKKEQDILYQDLLIPVTNFFRDTKTFDNLCQTVFPQIVKNKKQGEVIRVWVAGCSTGEEAYSVAICLREFIGDSLDRVQIFATDISEPAIIKARTGIYSKNIEEHISPQRLTEFFTRINGNYQVNKNIRNMCVFAVHNFLNDPPFGKMDFISCRNVLIYMEPYLQKKALTTFHYALNPKGFLLLGKSETTSGVATLFGPAALNDKLFFRKDVPSKFMNVASIRAEQKINYNNISKTEIIRTDFQKTADDILLHKYTPAGVVVNEDMDIMHFRGNTGNYLEQAPGKPSHNLLKMAKHGLAFELRNILHNTRKKKEPVTKENIPFQVNGVMRNISIEAMLMPNTVEPYYLILFQDHDKTANSELSITDTKGASGKVKNEKSVLRIQELERELDHVREDMRSITEEQEAANEELQSANEELLSSSEELQSLNEELETNKVELQSTNEELLVVNHEIINLNEQVTEERDYSEAIIATIHEPMIILDKDLRVVSANKSFYKNFHVKETETEGTLFYDLGSKQWDIPRLRKLLEEIIPQNSHFHDYEVTHTFPDIGKKIMLLNASRIIQKTQSKQMILLAIHDVTEVRNKIIELKLKEKELLVKDISDRKMEKDRLENAVEERTKELERANRLLIEKNLEKEKRAAELIIANKELAFQNEEKAKRAGELIIANVELAFQNEERNKRSAELVIANKELAFQNLEKEKRQAELVNINKELLAFAYVSSHDLQEPLRKVQIYSGRILDNEFQNLSDTGKNYFVRMQQAANRMQQLIQDLLNFSRINNTDKKFELTDLNEILNEVMEDLHDRIQEKQAVIKSTKLCSLHIIRFQFYQLIHNLINNSLKFSVSGKAPKIWITSKTVIGSKLNKEWNDNSTFSCYPNKKYCHLTIKDNGIGFDPQYKERIFEVFQKLHGKEEYAGTGIGLSIVKKIVENHNGAIRADSQLNEGATFDIYIPVD